MLPPFNAAQAFNDLDHVLRIEELYLLQRVAQKITSILDLETLLDQIVEDVANTFGYNRLAILLKDDRTEELAIAAGWTMNEGEAHRKKPPGGRGEVFLRLSGVGRCDGSNDRRRRLDGQQAKKFSGVVINRNFPSLLSSGDGDERGGRRLVKAWTRSASGLRTG